MITILNKNLFSWIAAMFVTLSFAGPLTAKCVFAGPLQVKELKVGNMLSWTTLQELDNKSFIVQKSMDGESFETVGTINGAGNSDE